MLAGACTEEKYGKMIEKRIQELGLEDRDLSRVVSSPGGPAIDWFAAKL